MFPTHFDNSGVDADDGVGLAGTRRPLEQRHVRLVVRHATHPHCSMEYFDCIMATKHDTTLALNTYIIFVSKSLAIVTLPKYIILSAIF